MMQLSRLADVRLVELPRHIRDDGEVVVAEGGTGVPFAIARLFVLRAPEGAALVTLDLFAFPRLEAPWHRAGR